MLSAGDDALAKLWCSETGLVSQTFRDHAGVIWSATLSANGALVLTASEDELAKLWRTATGECVQTFRGHTEAVSSAVFSIDGAQILTASLDTSAVLWKADSGRRVRTFDKHTGEVQFATFSPDGSVVLTSAMKGLSKTSSSPTVSLWNAVSGKRLCSFPGMVNLVYKHMSPYHHVKNMDSYSPELHVDADHPSRALLSSILLRKIEKKGMYSRMDPVPRDAQYVNEFLSHHEWLLEKLCNPPWMNMTREQRESALFSFMKQQFSTGPGQEEFEPRPGQKRRQSNISWNSFYMSAKEAAEMVRSVVDHYDTQAHRLQ